MHWRPWAGLLLLLTLASATVLVPSSAAVDVDNMGLARSYGPSYSIHPITDVDADPDSDYALIARGPEGVIAWNIETGKTIAMTSLSASPVVAVNIVEDRYLAVTENGGLIALDLEMANSIWRMDVMTGTVRVTAVSEFQSRLAVVGLGPDSDMTISFVDMMTLDVIFIRSRDLPEDLAAQIPTSALWLPAGVTSGFGTNTLLVGTNLGQIWAVESSGNATLILDLGSTVMGMGYSHGDGVISAATRNGRIHSVSVDHRRSIVYLETDFQGTRYLVCFDQFGDRVAVGGSNGHIEIWNMAGRSRSQTLRFHNYSVSDVVWRDDQNLVSAAGFGKVALWGLDTDGDLYADSLDAFPTDATEHTDTDGDGVGDNRDMFIMDPSEWKDTDNDGVGDNGDLFPKDPTEWADTDGDGSGDNGDFIPSVHNTVAAGIFLLGVGMVASVPVVRMVTANRRRIRRDREEAIIWIEQLGLEPVPAIGTPSGKDVLDRAVEALRVRTDADPRLLRETINARDTMVLNTMVALRVQEEISQRGGVGADAAMARSVQLRDQLQELDGERERLDKISKSYWEVQEAVDQAVRDTWPDLSDVEGFLDPLRVRVQVLDNTLAYFKKSSIIKIGEEATKDVRGAYVIASKELRVKGSDRPVGVKVGVPPRPEILVPEGEGADTSPLSTPPPMGMLRTRQAMLTREDTAELVVSVDNTLAEDLEELAVEFSIAGDRLRHKGPHRVELGILATGRSAAATFQMRVAPAPDPEDEPGELTRVLAKVSAKAGTRKVRQELPAKATTLVSSTIHRPGELDWVPVEDTVGLRGVRFPRVPSKIILETLEFPHGLMPMMDGDLAGGGTWRLFVSRTEEDMPLIVAIAVMPGPEYVELVVEVRGPEAFPARELAEEVIDTVRFAVLSDRRLRLRGEDKPMARDRVLQLSKMVAEAYLGSPEMGYGVNGEDEGSPS